MYTETKAGAKIAESVRGEWLDLGHTLRGGWLLLSLILAAVQVDLQPLT